MATILVIDDTPDIRDIITRQLHYAGHSVITAENGLAGIANAQRHLPDLIVMDLIMPDLDGMQAIERLRADSRCTHLPILAITARVLSDTARQAREAGCDAFMSKPFLMADLLDKVERLIDRQRSVPAEPLG
jgi:two-component system, cell cycle response regulator DivK